MVQQVDFRMLGRQISEVVQVFLLAAVVDQDDVGETVFKQSVYHGNELFIRIKRGQDYGDFG